MTTPSSLPPLLQPWAAELALFPPDLAPVLGDLVLRLHPLTGAFVRPGTDPAAEPLGVGDIARRGSYDRLLLSEWALADAAPDEFLRRAADGELLFSAPAPARSVRSLRSVVLFDAGPSQLGAPRLAHLALFILLARRAAQAGAVFAWGVLQQPDVLHAELDRPALLRLLGARTWAVPNAAHAAAWDAALDAGVADVADFWTVGGAGPRPARAHAAVTVQQAWQGNALDVGLTGRGRSARVVLPLPDERDAARLLRKPFEAAVAGTVAQSAKPLSLKRPPMFGTRPERIAVGMLDGSVTIFLIPSTINGEAGRPRNPAKLGDPDTVVAAGLHQKSFAMVTTGNGQLRFLGFPGAFANRSTGLPARERFHAVAGAQRWSPAFYLSHAGNGKPRERVLVLDKEGRLVSWRAEGEGCVFETVAEDVIGAVQQGDKILFAAGTRQRVDVYLLGADGKKEHLAPVIPGGDRFHFGDTYAWRGGGHLYAIRSSATCWIVGLRDSASEVEVAPGSTVLGCARSGSDGPAGLVVLNAVRKRIELVGPGSRTVLVESSEPIAQASFDPCYQRIAWLLQKSGGLTVQRLGDAQPLLRTLTSGGADHAR